MSSIIEKIKEFREKNNYSQEYLGSKLGMSQQAYQKIENGITDLKLELLIKLAKIYNVGCHEFIGNYDTEIQKLFDRKNEEINSLELEIKNLKEYIYSLEKLLNKSEVEQ